GREPPNSASNTTSCRASAPARSSAAVSEASLIRARFLRSPAGRYSLGLLVGGSGAPLAQSRAGISLCSRSPPQLLAPLTSRGNGFELPVPRAIRLRFRDFALSRLR